MGVQLSDDFKEFLAASGRQLLVAVITSAVIVAALFLAFRGASQEERNLQAELVELQRELVETERLLTVSQDQARDANLAMGCLLQLPVREDGRNTQRADWCYQQYDLPVPDINGP